MKQTNYASQKTNSENKPSNIRKVSFFKRIFRKTSGKKKRKKSQQNTQRIMTKATQWIAWCTAGLVVLNFFVLRETCSEFSVSHRPWVDVPGDIQIKSPLKFDNLGCHITVSYTLKNGGTAPALGVFVMPQTSGGLVFSSTMPKFVDCNDIRVTVNYEITPITQTYEKPSDITGDLLLPGETRRITVTLDWAGEPTNLPPTVWYPVCICYKDERKNPHQTSIMWRFMPLKTSANKNTFLLKKGEFTPGSFERAVFHNNDY